LCSTEKNCMKISAYLHTYRKQFIVSDLLTVNLKPTILDLKDTSVQVCTVHESDLVFREVFRLLTIIKLPLSPTSNCSLNSLSLSKYVATH